MDDDDNSKSESENENKKKEVLSREDIEEKEREDLVIMMMAEGMTDGQFQKWLKSQRSASSNCSSNRNRRTRRNR